jgi:hypothetical protein
MIDNRSEVDTINNTSSQEPLPNMKVSHWLQFSSEEDRNAFSEKVSKSHFRVENESYYGNWDVPFCIQISKEESLVNEEDLQAEVKYIKQTAQKLKGIYDAWETVKASA